MSLKLRRVESPGDLERERVVLRATADSEIGDYAVFCCVVSADGDPIAGPLNAFWFENKKVKKGDLVVIYSKSGAKSQEKGDAGSTSYFYYWKSKTPLWTTGMVPVLVDTPDWEVGDPIK